jgi:hypothetical protein
MPRLTHARGGLTLETCKVRGGLNFSGGATPPTPPLGNTDYEFNALKGILVLMLKKKSTYLLSHSMLWITYRFNLFINIIFFAIFHFENLIN